MICATCNDESIYRSRLYALCPDRQGLQLKVKGDGRSYKLRLATNETYRFSSVSFQAAFTTVKGEWTTVTVPFADLKAGWRGRSIDTPFDPAKIRKIGIILADKKEGPFVIEAREISVWKDPSAS